MAGMTPEQIAAKKREFDDFLANLRSFVSKHGFEIKASCCCWGGEAIKKPWFDWLNQNLEWESQNRYFGLGDNAVELIYEGVLSFSVVAFTYLCGAFDHMSDEDRRALRVEVIDKLPQSSEFRSYLLKYLPVSSSALDPGGRPASVKTPLLSN